MVKNRNLFRQTGLQKGGKVKLLFGLLLVRRICEETMTSRNPNQNRAILRQIFSSNKVRQRIGRKDSIQTVIRTSRSLDSFLYEAAQNFKVFSYIQK
jgi:hypothetical protein